ncbi:hypothetical protein FHG87_008599, partial [Trinorchestia longiramus]
MQDFSAIRATPLLSGHTVVPFDEAEAEEYEKHWKGYTFGLVRFMPGGWVMPSPLTHFHDAIMKFK